MRFGKKDYKALVGMDPAVAKVGAAPSSGVGDDVEMIAALLCTTLGHQAILLSPTLGHQAILLSPSRTSSSSTWDKASPAVL